MFVWNDSRAAACDRGGTVGTYILLSTLTSEGSQTLHANPQRLSAVDEEIEAFGCKILSQYPVLGPYDFVTIIEAPDNETVAHLSVDLGSRGTDRILSLPAIPLNVLLKKTWWSRSDGPGLVDGRRSMWQP
jgi:uncharacterized protein with GYD domain